MPLLSGAFLLPIPPFSFTLNRIKRRRGIPASAREDFFYGMLLPAVAATYGVVPFSFYSL